MSDFVIYTDFRTSKFRRSHVVVDEKNSVTVWCPTFTEVLNHILDKGTTNAVIVGDFGKFAISFNALDDSD